MPQWLITYLMIGVLLWGHIFLAGYLNGTTGKKDLGSALIIFTWPAFTLWIIISCIAKARRGKGTNDNEHSA